MAEVIFKPQIIQSNPAISKSHWTSVKKSSKWQGFEITELAQSDGQTDRNQLDFEIVKFDCIVKKTAII